MTKLTCTHDLIEETLAILRRSGSIGSEGIALWLAKRTADDDVGVAEVVEPLHRAAVDFFHIPPEGMTALMAHLRKSRLRLVAQVHSHPGKAFHSKADDEWAIVRHEGALSLVIPDFAHRTTTATFLKDAAIFRLSSADKWEPVQQDDYGQHVVIR